MNTQILEHSIHIQIENAYLDHKANRIIQDSIIPAIHEEYTISYHLDDYNRFPSLRETMVEIIDDVFIKKVKGAYILQVRAENEFFVDSNDLPLIIVDGVPVPDLKELLDINVRDIDKINISKGDYYLGPEKYHGMVSFKTKTAEFHSNLNNKNTVVWEIPAPLPKKVYYTPKYTMTSKEAINHLPDFRSQLLWTPNLSISAGEHHLNFYTSDNTGVFEITLSGFSTEGKPVHLKEEFLVE